MLRSKLFAALLCLSACVAPATTPNASPTALASEAEILAAEAAPLHESDARMNAAFEPFTVDGNVHYVGGAGVSAFLITTPEGHFLLDGGFAQTAPRIIRNIEALGYRIEDVRDLLNSHAHYDHAAGLARLQHASGAEMIASAGDRPILEAGRISYGPSAGVAFPPVRIDRVIGDGETLTLGGVTMTAHLTPGHTPGCTSWSTDIYSADGAARRVFFHCSATVAGQSLAPPAYPTIVEDFRATFERVGAMRADITLANHGVLFDLAAKRERQRAGEADAFVDPGELQRLNTRLGQAFETELSRQQSAQ